MTLVELQNILGDQILEVKDAAKMPRETQKKVIDSATVLSSLAKQMINNADVILRTEKLVSDGKLKESAIVEMISHGKRK